MAHRLLVSVVAASFVMAACGGTAPVRNPGNAPTTAATVHATGRATVSPAPTRNNNHHRRGASTPSTPPHIFLVVLENHGFNDIVGNPDAPYLNSLIDAGGLATNYKAIRHPSLPNYLAMTGGSTFGIKSDCTSCAVHATNLADQLEGAGLTWMTYQESIPRPCYLGGYAGNYAKKHDPFVYYTDISKNSSRCRSHVVPLTQLNNDMNGNSPPNFSFITPNLCHDMHDCSVSSSDKWLSGFIPQITSSSAFADNGILIVTFDEGTDSSNQVATIVASSMTKPGSRSNTAFSHYSLLRTIEDEFGLPPLRHAGDVGTNSMVPAFLS